MESTANMEAVRLPPHRIRQMMSKKSGKNSRKNSTNSIITDRYVLGLSEVLSFVSILKCVMTIIPGSISTTVLYANKLFYDHGTLRFLFTKHYFVYL